ncbi:PCNA-interacting partner [Trichonephila inaurata madagascariensis]|uniref:PCNA-interacting partner n=1 Tax=Trichonephila inaurata madagascariensis TaxID=2747483 RepID=A0A8X6YQK7_9ARAC|nr:PCNA-interacting partner [Trichonephila inaurata madagascariensis]
MSKSKVWLWKEPDSRLKDNVLGLIKDAGSVETDTVLLHCIDVEGFDESIPLTKFILNLCESFNVFKNERTLFLNLKDLLQAIELCLGRSACKSECSELKIPEEEIIQCLQTYIEQFKYKDEISLENNVLNLNTFIEENNFADLWLINNKLSEQKINNSNYMDQLAHSNYLILGTLPSEIFQNIIRLLTIEERVLNVIVETPLNSSLQGSPSSTSTNTSSNIEVTSEIIEITGISLVPESEMKLGSATEEFIEETILSFLSLLVNSRSELALSKAMISPIIDLSHKAFTELRHLSEKKEMPMCQTAISYVTKIKLGGKGYAPPPDCPMLPHFKKLELFVDTLNQMQTLIEEDLTPVSAVTRLINVLKKKLLKCGSDNLRTTAIETVTENLQNIAIKVLDLQLESVNVTPQVCQASLDFLQHFINYINCSCWTFNPKYILSLRHFKRTPISLPPLLGYFRSPEEETSCDVKSVLNEDSTTSNMFAPPPLMSYFHHSESSSAVGTCVDSITPSKLTFKGCMNIFDDNENAKEYEVKPLKKNFKSNKACKRSILNEITNENPPEKIKKNTEKKSKNYIKEDIMEKKKVKSLPKKETKTKGSKKFKLIEGQGKITNFFLKK